MDSQGALPSMSDFTDADRNDLQRFLEQEQQKAKFQQNVHSLTGLCWTKCITGPIKSAGVDRSESSCLENCVNRYIDAQKSVIKELEGMGQ